MLKPLINATLPSLPANPWLESTLTFSEGTEFALDALGNAIATEEKSKTVKARLRKPGIRPTEIRDRGVNDYSVEFIGILHPEFSLDGIAEGSKGTDTINGVAYNIELLACPKVNISEMASAIGTRIRILAHAQTRAES